MTAFNYLWTSGPRTELRIPRTFHNSVCGLAAAIATVMLMGAIDQHRLHAALTREAAGAGAFAGAQRDAARAQHVYQEARTAVLLDRRIAAMQDSGSREAQLLANIAAALPTQMWLRSIERDPNALVLSGEAKGLGTIAVAMRSISVMKAVAAVKLVRVASAGTHHALVAYSIRVERRP